MNIKNKQELIDRFNAGELEGAEREEFIRLMENDSALAEDVKLSKKMDDFFSKNMERVEMLEKLNSIYYKLKAEGKLSTESNVQKKNKHIFHIKWYHIAASIIILLGISFALCFMLRPPKNERLYAQYFIPYRGDYITRSVEEHPKPEDKFHKALDQYNDGHYEKSWKMFNDLSLEDSHKIRVMLFKGISAMEINKYDDAISSFKYIIKDNTTLYVEPSEWYLALCYLKISDISKAKEIFTKLFEIDSETV